MSDYIPHELLVDILVRLPVASLLRFKSVCKSWNSLITDPSLVTKHLNHSKTNSEKILLSLCTERDLKECYLLCRDDDKFSDEFLELEFPFRIQSEKRRPLLRSIIVGSCNGVLCLLHEFPGSAPRVILWNPSVRKSVTLPVEPKVWRMFALGVGTHPTTHEFKVVRIVYETSPTNVEIYTLGTRSWKAIVSTLTPHWHIEPMASQAFVNGAVNWIAKDSWAPVGYCNSIVSFDMGTETFSVMTLPPMLTNQNLRTNRDKAGLYVKVFQGSPAVLCNRPRDNDNYCIWVMKKYGVPESWTWLSSFKLDLSVVVLKETLGFSKHGEFLLLPIDNRLLSYKIGTNALIDTGIRGRPRTIFHVEPFGESLVLVGK